jgi:hypothetical protein
MRTVATIEGTSALVGRSYALGADAPQQAFELGHMAPDAFEIETSELEEPGRRARDDGCSPLARQEERDLTTHVTGTKLLYPTISQSNFGLALLYEVNSGSVGVAPDELDACLDLHFAQHVCELVELGCRQIGEDRER